MNEPIRGKLEQLYPHFYRLCAPNPGPMTGPGTNTYLYGAQELAVFDAGPAISEHVSAILAAQDQLQAPITKLFASHTHNDHSPAIAKLAKELDDVTLIGIPASKNQQFEDYSFDPDQLPNDEEIYGLPTGDVKAIHTPGHVGNHVCYLIKEYNLLTTGDHLMNGSTVVIVPPKGNMKDYIASLEKLLSYDIDVMAPGHGALIKNPMEVVRWTIQHRLKRESKVLDNMSSEKTTIQDLVALVYDDVDVSLHKIAELSLRAHLIKLASEHRVEESNDSWRLL